MSSQCKFWLTVCFLVVMDANALSFEEWGAKAQTGLRDTVSTVTSEDSEVVVEYPGAPGSIILGGALSLTSSKPSQGSTLTSVAFSASAVTFPLSRFGAGCEVGCTYYGTSRYSSTLLLMGPRMMFRIASPASRTHTYLFAAADYLRSTRTSEWWDYLGAGTVQSKSTRDGYALKGGIGIFAGKGHVRVPIEVGVSYQKIMTIKMTVLSVSIGLAGVIYDAY
jgi:hypothetical protein